MVYYFLTKLCFSTINKVATNEVHLIFDKPGRRDFNPKAFKHNRQYNKTNIEHQHYT